MHQKPVQLQYPTYQAPYPYAYPSYSPPQQYAMYPPVQQPYYQAPVPQTPVTYKVMANGPEKAIHLQNVNNLNELQIDAPTLKNKGFFKNERMLGEYKLSFSPDGYSHNISLKYGGKEIKGSPFKISPRKAEVVMPTNFSSQFKVKNVYDKSHLRISAPTVPFQIYKAEKEPNTYDVHYQPGQQAHNIKVYVRNQLADKGSFTVAPRQQPNMQYWAPPVPYQAATPGYYAQQPGVYAPPQNVHPGQSIRNY